MTISECESDEAARLEDQLALADIARDKMQADPERVMIVPVRNGDGPMLEAYLDMHIVRYANPSAQSLILAECGLT